MSSIVYFEGKSVTCKHRPVDLRGVVVIVSEIIPFSLTSQCLSRVWEDSEVESELKYNGRHVGPQWNPRKSGLCQEAAITGHGDIAEGRKKCILLIRGLAKGDNRPDSISNSYLTHYWAPGLESFI